MSDVQEVNIGMKRSDDGELVEFGVAFPNGGFFPFNAQRAGDYDEALAADAKPEPQPETPAPAPEASQPEPSAVPENEGQ